MKQIADITNVLPPRSVATDPATAIYTDTTSGSAKATNLWSTYVGPDGITGAPAGKVLVEFEALTNDVYFRCARSATTATTTSTGAVLKVGTPRVFYLDPSKDLYIDQIAAGVGVIKWRVIGPIGERQRH